MTKIQSYCRLVFVLSVLVALSQAVPAQEAPSRAENQQSQLQPRSVMRFITDNDFPPFNFNDEDGVLIGFNVDLARAICLEIETPCDVSARPWGELLSALKRREADAVIAAHRVTASMLEQVDFSDRYFQTPARFAARRDEEKVDVSPDALDGKTIGVVRGTPHEAYLRAFFRDSPIELFDRAELAREALTSGKISYVFDDGISLVFWLNGTVSRGCCELRGGPYMEPKFFGDGIAIAVAKNDRKTLALINSALQRVRESGRLDELVQRYFPMRVY